jgi:hypothetical protein
MPRPRGGASQACLGRRYAGADGRDSTQLTPRRRLGMPRPRGGASQACLRRRYAGADGRDSTQLTPRRRLGMTRPRGGCACLDVLLTRWRSMPWPVAHAAVAGVARSVQSAGIVLGSFAENRRSFPRGRTRRRCGSGKVRVGGRSSRLSRVFSRDREWPRKPQNRSNCVGSTASLPTLVTRRMRSMREKFSL